MRRALSAEDFREEILQYLSQEMNSHASMIVGFSVVLFAYLEIVVRHYFEPPLSFNPRIPTTWQDIQCGLVLLVLIVIVWSLVFTLFRLGFYGLLTRATLQYNKTTSRFNDMWNSLMTEGIDKERLFGIFPTKWFTSGFLRPSRGLIISLALSIVICFFLALTLFWKL